MAVMWTQAHVEIKAILEFPGVWHGHCFGSITSICLSVEISGLLR